MNKNDFLFINNLIIKKWLSFIHDEILARCAGRAEFGARALGTDPNC